MLDPAQLAALAAVSRRGAFDLAAAELSVTPSAISQRIRALEEQVGTLLIRRGQPCIATPAGQRLIRHFDEIALLETRLALDLPALGPGPVTLRIAVNADSLATWVLPALSACAGFLYDLVIDDQDVSQEQLRRGEVVAAITASAAALQGCDQIALGALRYRATASPSYIAQWLSAGITADSLSQAPTLIFSQADRLQHLWAVRQGALPASGLPGHRLASSQGFVEACRLGLGWALNPEALVSADLASGALVELIPDTALDVGLYWQFTRLVAPALAPVTRQIRLAAAQALVPAQEPGASRI